MVSIKGNFLAHVLCTSTLLFLTLIGGMYTYNSELLVRSIEKHHKTIVISLTEIDITQE